jgi:hypothetical protein
LFISPMGEPFRGGPGALMPIMLWFSVADANADGRLSREEFVGQAMVFFLNRLDANGDQTATSQESTSLWQEHAPEMLAGAPIGPRRGLAGPPRGGPPRGGPPQGGPGGGPQGGPQGGPGGNMGGMRPPPDFDLAEMSGARVFGIMDDVEPVMSCDADFSRRVTAAEFEACAQRRFDLLDVNRDGAFELSESPRGQMMAEGRRPPPPREWGSRRNAF